MPNRITKTADQPKSVSELRVVFISDAIPNRNGVGTYYQDLLEHLADHLQAATLISPIAKGEGKNCIFSLAMPGDSTQRLYYPQAGRILKQIEEVAPHLIVTATPGPYGLLGRKYAIRHGAQFCVGYHTDFEKLSELYWSGIKRWINRTCVGYFNRKIYRSAALVVTTSDAMVESARKESARKVIVVGTPIAMDFFTTPASNISARLQTVFYAGRLAPEKNIEKIIEAAKNLPHMLFKIAGDGPLRADVERQAASLQNLEYLGWLTRQAIIATLDQVELLVLPSSIESFGTVALEAMSRKRLVLVSSDCGILEWQFLAQGIYQVQQGENITQAIQRIEKLTPQERSEKVANAYRSAQEFNAKTRDQWLNIFAELTLDQRTS